MSIDFPRAFQGLFDPEVSRYRVYYGGRGSGKSWAFARALLTKAAKKRLRVLCAREIQRTIADSVHRLLTDQIVELGLEGFYTVTDAEIRGRNGSEFLFAGLRHQDIAKVKSLEGVDICWVEEGQVVTAKSWGVLIPTIRKPDSEIWVSFNPELDSDPTYAMFVEHPPADAVVRKVNWSDNKYFPEVLDKERLALQARDPEAYRNVWEGECRSSVEGAIYAKEIAAMLEEGRVRAVPYDPLLPVHTVWDLGWNDAMSLILVQRGVAEIRIIGHIEDTHRTLADYVAQLNEHRYVWGHDWLPHDGRARDFKSGKSAEEMLTALGRSPRIVENLGIEAGISAARMIFPRTYIDTKCERLIHCLKRYRRSIHATTNEPGPPLHDEHSHSADCFRYLAVAVDEMTNAPTIKDPYAGFKRAYA